jgi:flagellar hook-associated protein 2
VTSQGADARLTFGSGPGAYSVSSSSNTFASIVPGVTVVVRALSVTPVVVDVSVDSASLADKVSGLVDAVNATLTEIATRTAFDPATKKSASLTGNVSVRRLGQELTQAVLSTVKQSALSAPGLSGVSTDRNGKITFDRAKFLAAYEKDPTAVRRLFVQGATSTGTVSFVGSTDDTRIGTASVSVGSLSAAGTIQGVPAAWGAGVTTPIVVRRGTNTVSVNISAAETVADARTALAAAIDAAGLAINVSVVSGQLKFTAAAVGSASSFDVAWDGTAFNAALGADVAGTINGVAAIGTGNLLLAAVGTPGVAGLTVQTDGTTLGAVGTLDYEPGIAQRLAQVLADSTTPTTGYLSTAEKNRQTRIESLNTTIDAYDRRLAKRELALKAQYSALEVALGKLKSQSNFLTSQIATATNNTNG